MQPASTEQALAKMIKTAAHGARASATLTYKTHRQNALVTVIMKPKKAKKQLRKRAKTRSKK